MNKSETVSLPELARLTGYAYGSLVYRVNAGHIPSTRDAKGQYRIPVSAIAELQTRPKYARRPSA